MRESSHLQECPHCNSRKARRPCPVLGSICTVCCGRHRRREIDCPEECTYLFGTAEVERASEVVRSALARLHPFLWEQESFPERARDAFFGDVEAHLLEEEVPAFFFFLLLGYEDSDGCRGIDRFIRERGGTLPGEYRDGIAALHRAQFSLFRVNELRPGAATELLDLASGEVLTVRLPSSSKRLVVGKHYIDWVVDVARLRQIAGTALEVPDIHVDRLREMLRLARSKDRRSRLDFRLPEVRSVRQVIPQIHRQIRGSAVRSRVSGVRQEAVYEVLEPDTVRARLSSLRDVEASTDGRHFLWKPPARGRASPRGSIELRSVRLSLTAPTRDDLRAGRQFLERVCQSLIRHRLDRGTGPEPAQPLPASPDSGGGARSADESVRTFTRHIGRWIRHRVASGEPQSPPHRPAREQRERSGSSDIHSVPILAHERMCRLVPGLREAILEAADDIRQRGREGRVLTQPDLLNIERLVSIVKAHTVASARTHSRRYALDDGDLLACHALYALNFELHRRKTFWVDESLAWMLCETNLDLVGAALEPPFAAFSLAFTDRGTLEIAESLLSQTPGSHQNVPLRIVTVYVTTYAPTEEGARHFNLSLLFDAPIPKWPYLISRDLWIRAEDDLASILDSHCPDVSVHALDPLFLMPELKKLIHLAINATLYATSADVEPIVLGSPERGAPLRRRGRKKGPTLEAVLSSEEVLYLPGRIPVSHVKYYRDLARNAEGRTIMKRFMVRGHWRRANPNWSDQRLRWIEPYWKGPDMGTVIEREYRLKP